MNKIESVNNNYGYLKSKSNNNKNYAPNYIQNKNIKDTVSFQGNKSKKGLFAKIAALMVPVAAALTISSPAPKQEIPQSEPVVIIQNADTKENKSNLTAEKNNTEAKTTTENTQKPETAQEKKPMQAVNTQPVGTPQKEVPAKEAPKKPTAGTPSKETPTISTAPENKQPDNTTATTPIEENKKPQDGVVSGDVVDNTEENKQTETAEKEKDKTELPTSTTETENKTEDKTEDKTESNTTETNKPENSIETGKTEDIKTPEKPVIKSEYNVEIECDGDKTQYIKMVDEKLKEMGYGKEIKAQVEIDNKGNFKYIQAIKPDNTVELTWCKVNKDGSKTETKEHGFVEGDLVSIGTDSLIESVTTYPNGKIVKETYSEDGFSIPRTKVTTYPDGKVVEELGFMEGVPTETKETVKDGNKTVVKTRKMGSNFDLIETFKNGKLLEKTIQYDLFEYDFGENNIKGEEASRSFKYTEDGEIETRVESGDYYKLDEEGNTTGEIVHYTFTSTYVNGEIKERKIAETNDKGITKTTTTKFTKNEDGSITETSKDTYSTDDMDWEFGGYDGEEIEDTKTTKTLEDGTVIITEVHREMENNRTKITTIKDNIKTVEIQNPHAAFNSVSTYVDGKLTKEVGFYNNNACIDAGEEGSGFVFFYDEDGNKTVKYFTKDTYDEIVNGNKPEIDEEVVIDDIDGFEDGIITETLEDGTVIIKETHREGIGGSNYSKTTTIKENVKTVETDSHGAAIRRVETFVDDKLVKEVGFYKNDGCVTTDMPDGSGYVFFYDEDGNKTVKYFTEETYDEIVNGNTEETDEEVVTDDTIGFEDDFIEENKENNETADDDYDDISYGEGSVTPWIDIDDGSDLEAVEGEAVDE